MSRVWDDGPDDKSEVLVLLALADFCNDSGECWPSVASIAKKSRLSERGLQKIILRLVEAGWLKIDYRKGRSGSNLYTILTPNPVHPEPRSPRTRCKNPEPRSKNPEPRSPKPLEPSIEPSLLGADAPKPKKTPKKAVQLPDGWVPNDRNMQDATDRNFSQQEIAHEADQFRNYHHAKGTTYKNWDAAWRTWLGNARKFSGGSGRSQSDALASQLSFAATTSFAPGEDIF